MTIKTAGIDHIHFNVKNLKRFNELMGRLFGEGATLTQVYQLEHVNIYNSCVRFPTEDGPFMDVFQAVDESSPIAEMIRERGQGVSYVSFRVEGIEDAAEHAKNCGLKEVSRIGYRGLKQVQFDTHEDLGFMMEFVEYDADFDAQMEEVHARAANGETIDGLREAKL